MTSNETLSVKRKADREHMLNQLIEVALTFGCDVDISRNKQERTERVTLNVTSPQGLCVMICLDGGVLSGSNVFLAHWHMELNCEKQLNSHLFGGNVNPYHFRKATYLAKGFDALRLGVVNGLTLAANGNAFKP